MEYDAEKYQLKVFLLKQHEGEFFEDLDMLTKLLSKNKKKHTNSKKPLIELLEVKPPFSHPSIPMPWKKKCPKTPSLKKLLLYPSAIVMALITSSLNFLHP